MMRAVMGRALILLPVLTLPGLAGCQAPSRSACAIPAAQPMLVTNLYFGRTGVPDAAWNDFVAASLTPAFPDGFTVYPAFGQWRDPRSGQVAREPVSVVQIATPAGAMLAWAVETISARYRHDFKQVSVGVVSSPGCGTFQ